MHGVMVTIWIIKYVRGINEHALHCDIVVYNLILGIAMCLCHAQDVKWMVILKKKIIIILVCFSCWQNTLYQWMKTLTRR